MRITLVNAEASDTHGLVEFACENRRGLDEHDNLHAFWFHASPFVARPVRPICLQASRQGATTHTLYSRVLVSQLFGH